MANNDKPMSYEEMHRHEILGDSFADPNGPSEASKAAFLKQQAAAKAAEFKAIEAERQKRLNWQPASVKKAIAKLNKKGK